MATISSHALNSTDGTHAGGIAVALTSLDAGVTLFETEMDAGGRLVQQVESNLIDTEHCYELVFRVRSYWKSKGIDCTNIRDEIVLRFMMPDPDARYHMPIILSPYGYSTWASVPEK